MDFLHQQSLLPPGGFFQVKSFSGEETRSFFFFVWQAAFEFSFLVIPLPLRTKFCGDFFSHPFFLF